MVGLGDRMEHFPSQLSGGQQQRVAIARALVNQPAILLADEPTGNLDSRTSVEIMEIFQKLNDAGLTVILVTHEPDIARFAKRSIVFRDGKIRRDELVNDRPDAAKVLESMPGGEEECGEDVFNFHYADRAAGTGAQADAVRAEHAAYCYQM